MCMFLALKLFHVCTFLSCFDNIASGIFFETFTDCTGTLAYWIETGDSNKEMWDSQIVYEYQHQWNKNRRRRWRNILLYSHAKCNEWTFWREWEVTPISDWNQYHYIVYVTRVRSFMSFILVVVLNERDKRDDVHLDKPKLIFKGPHSSFFCLSHNMQIEKMPFFWSQSQSKMLFIQKTQNCVDLREKKLQAD